MIAWFLGLAAATQAAAPDTYRAIGASPFWQVSIYADGMTFETPGRDRLSVQRPVRQETASGFTWRSDELSVTVVHRNCTDRLNGRTYADHVMVVVGRAHYEGCGGAIRGAALPMSYGAAGGEPFWSLEIGEGRLYFGVNEYVVIVPTPRVVVSRDRRTRRYTAPGISVTLRRQNCDLEDERTYADAVTVVAGQWRVEGCGGRVVREAPGG